MNGESQNKPLLEVKHLKQYFGTVKKPFKAVDDISFCVYKGEAFGLVGESGSGKTTTGRAIVGLYPITGGEILFNGKRIVAGTEIIKKEGDSVKRELKKNDELRKKIQMIFQDPLSSLNPRMVVKEIVAEGLIVQGQRCREVLERKVYKALEEVGLSREQAGRYPHEFSGGQRQRIGIARALVTDPEMIVADEPVSALDVSVQAQVINLLGDLKKRRGLTVLFVAHDLSVVKYFCDRIGVIYKGKLVEIAPSDELFENPLHPYTKELLSAIPLPDPLYERSRERKPFKQWETGKNARLIQASEGHFVLTEEE